MKIIVVGCGKIGKTIIASLTKEHHDVTAIDSDAKVTEEIRNAYDVIGITGSGTEYDVMTEAGVSKAELFIAVTGSDELNMLSCFAARRMGAKHTVARIRDLENNDESLSFMSKHLELSLAINPEKMAAEAIYNILKLPSATKVETFSRGRFEIVEVLLGSGSPLDGLSLMELRKKYQEKFLVSTVERDGEVYIPNGTFVLKSGDKVGVITLRKEAHRVLSAIGHTKISVKNVMIIGAGKVSNYLAKILLATRHSVKLIDIDPEVCEEVCEVLPDNATVVCGNGMSQELLTEEGLDSADAIVALTGRDEDNILISVYSAGKNVPKVILKVNSDELTPIAENLGLNSIISPRKIVADVMVKYARALENSMGSTIETLYSLCGGRAEAVEFKIMDDFEYAGVPLKEMKLSSGVLIAGISREKDDILPSGDDVILPGDRVIIIAGGKRILSLSDIFAG